MIKFSSLVLGATISALSIQVGLASGAMEPVEGLAVQPKSQAHEVDDLGKVLGNGEIIFGGVPVCPNFEYLIRNKLQGLPDRTVTKLVRIFDGSTASSNIHVREEAWPKAHFLIEAYVTSGLSELPDFAKGVVALSKKLMSQDLSTEYHLKWLLSPMVISRCPQVKQVVGLIPSMKEKHFYATRFNEAKKNAVSRGFYATQPKKEHFTTQCIHLFVYDWLREEAVLRLCNDHRDLNRLLKLMGTDYKVPFFRSADVLDPKCRDRMYWLHDEYLGSDNVLGWLQHSGTLAACENLDHLEALFEVFAGMATRTRGPLFQWTQKTDVLNRLCPDISARIEFLKFFVGKNTREDAYAMEAMAFVGAVMKEETVSRVQQIYSLLAEFVPEQRESDDKVKNGRHLTALMHTYALDLCESAAQVDRLLSEFKKGATVKRLVGPMYAQQFVDYESMVRSLSQMAESPLVTNKLEEFYHEHYLDASKKARYIFADTITHWRATYDRDVLLDAVRLAAYNVEEKKDCGCSRDMKDASDGKHAQHEARKLLDALFTCTMEYGDRYFPQVVDAVLSWTQAGAMHKHMYGMYSHRPLLEKLEEPAPQREAQPLADVLEKEIGYMSKLTKLQRAFFLDLPYDVSDYRYTCAHSSVRVPVKGPALMLDFLGRAGSLPSDLLDEIIADAKANTLKDIKPGWTDKETIYKKLGELRNRVYEEYMGHMGYGDKYWPNLKRADQPIVPKGKEELGARICQGD